MIPTRQMCKQLWEDMRLSDNLKQHFQQIIRNQLEMSLALEKQIKTVLNVDSLLFLLEDL